MITFHFLNVGQGNMAIGIFPNGMILAYDCNITTENEASVFEYLRKIMPKNYIDVFVNSHRDADHMRGIKKLHEIYPIGTIWDSGVSGNTETQEYVEYMDLKRNLPCHEVSAGSRWTGNPNVTIINGKRDDLDDPNSQSVVLHINHNGSVLLLAGDTSATTWRDHIMPQFGSSVKSLVLYASHHGSFSFFNENRDIDDDYTEHIEAINPAISIISVSSTNPHGHPDDESIQYYERHSHGATNGQKIFRTDEHGNMKLELLDNATGFIYWNQ